MHFDFNFRVFLIVKIKFEKKNGFQPELIEAYGYPSEVHNVITEDGYILEVHRIANFGRQPVILMHGMLDSSTTWVMIGPKHSFGKPFPSTFDRWFCLRNVE